MEGTNLRVRADFQAFGSPLVVGEVSWKEFIHSTLPGRKSLAPGHTLTGRTGRSLRGGVREAGKGGASSLPSRSGEAPWAQVTL